MTTTRDPERFEAVPPDLASLLDPAWLAWALDDIAEGEVVVGVERVDASRTLAEKVRFTVTVEDRAGARRTNAYCVKAHFDGSGLDTLSPEARYYRDLAPRVAVRGPHPYYAGVDGEAHRAIIVMDDVVACGGRFLNAHEPYSLDTTRDSLSQLAHLHAGTWGEPTPPGCEWLAPTLRQVARRFPADMLQGLLDDGRGAGVAPGLLDAELLKEAVRRTAELPLTCVLHGDTHSGNVYLDAEGRACWLDWQVVQPGNWATDVSYHLGTVLSVEDRRAHEVALLRHYLAELARLGAAAPPWEEAWDLYRSGFAFGYFMWAITSVSSREVVLIHFPRLAAALTDHDTYRRLGLPPAG